MMHDDHHSPLLDDVDAGLQAEEDGALDDCRPRVGGLDGGHREGGSGSGDGGGQGNGVGETAHQYAAGGEGVTAVGNGLQELGNGRSRLADLRSGGPTKREGRAGRREGRE